MLFPDQDFLLRQLEIAFSSASMESMVRRRFIMRHFFRYQLYCVIVFYILLQQEMKCLADARRFYPFHSDTLFQKIVASLRNWIYAEMPLVTIIVYFIL